MQYAIPSNIATTLLLCTASPTAYSSARSRSLAISGLAITFPLMNLCCTRYNGRVGALPLPRWGWGRKDYGSANKIAGNVFLMILIISAIFYHTYANIPGNRYSISLGASEDTLPYAHDFTFIILSNGNHSPLFQLQRTDKSLRATSEIYDGKPLSDGRCKCDTQPTVYLGFVWGAWWHWRQSSLRWLKWRTKMKDSFPR